MRFDPCAYRLHSEVKYRREPFGSVVLRVDHQRTRFFNHGASQVLELIAGGAARSGWSENFENLSAEDERQCDLFAGELLANGIIEQRSNAAKDEALVFDNTEWDEGAECSEAPLGVEIELTLKCSRACQYCAYEALPTFPTQGELTTAEWIDVLKGLEAAGVFFVRFTGGDPLLRSDFSELIRAADDLRLIVTVGSDLTILPDSVASALASTVNLYALQTTLDGSSAATADSLRGHGNFAAVTRGISSLKRLGVPVIVGTVLTKRNIPEIPEIARLVGSLGADGYCVAPLYASGRAQSDSMSKLIPDNDDLGMAARLFASAIQSGMVKPADPAWMGATAELSQNEIAEVWKDQPFLVRAPDQLVRIDPRGRVYTSIKLKPTLGEDVYVGSVRDRSIGELWREAPQLRNARKAAQNSTFFGNVFDIRAEG